MKATVRTRRYKDGRSVLQVDIVTIPAGAKAPERYRLSPPQGVTRSGAQRWGLEEARRIAVEGPPYQARRAHAQRVEREEEIKRLNVPTLGEFWPTFIDQLKTDRKKPSTVETYELVLKNKLMPLFADTKLDKFVELDVQRLKASMRDQAPSYVNQVLTVLSVVLQLAKVHYPRINLPPISRMKPATEETLRFYSHEEAAALVRAVEKEPARLAAVLCSLDAGLRKGEVNALRWVDVDLEHREITVRHTLHRGKLVAPKSGRARRVPMTKRLIAVVEDLGRSTEWVLPRNRPKKPDIMTRYSNAPVSLDQTVRLAAKRAGVPDHKPHALRHTWIARLLAAGADLQAVAKLAGHRSVITTARYSHMLPGADRAAVALLDDFVAPEKVGTQPALGPKPDLFRGKE